MGIKNSDALIQKYGGIYMNYEILKERGILLNNLSICKDKINLVSGACVKPFAENIWVISAGDMYCAMN